MSVTRQRSWFEAWGEEQAQNRFLKGLLLVLLISLAALAASLAVVSLKTLPVVILREAETTLVNPEKPEARYAEAEALRVAEKYMKAHYNWRHETIDEAFAAAALYVGDSRRKAFAIENSLQTRVAKEKKISQYFFPIESTHDAKVRRVTVKGERVVIVDGLRAAMPLGLEVTYEFGPRTNDNPEGVYIVAERRIEGGEP